MQHPDPGRNPEPPLLQAFYPALDGLRAVAILLVFSWHYCRLVSTSAVWNWCWVGVDVFFVLSGFLITGILVNTRQRPDYFRVFYTRRTLRIFPLYYAVWLALLAATPFFHLQWNLYVVATAVYCGNLLKAGAPALHPDPGTILYFPRHSAPGFLLVDHFWSLCVEEQFYLIWPLLLWLVRSNRRLLNLCLALVVAGTAGRLAYQHLHAGQPPSPVLYYHTLARADALVLGAAVFLYLYCFKPSRTTVRRLAVAAVVFSTAALILIRTLAPGIRPLPPEDPWILTGGLFFINLASAGLLLLAIDSGTWLYALLNRQPLIFLGRISYGLYVFNELIYVQLSRLLPCAHGRTGRALFVLGCFGATTVCAVLSFRLIESPFLRLKKTISPRPGAVDDPPPLPLTP